MTLETQEVEELIEEEIEEADVSAREQFHPGEQDAGQHFELRVVSPEFEDMSRIQQHRRVHDALDDYMGGVIHSVEIDTRTP
ncbi:MAG: BolA family protein [Halobacteria archaeon]